ncbi:hypothetical protein D3C86_765540 [compost metagenome]
MAFLAPIINEQQFDANGDPLTGGTISVYLAGTSTPAATFNDRDGLPAHANSWPITLNTIGLNSQGAVWLVGGQTYKFVIKDINLVTLRTIDYVSGINDAFAANDQWVIFGGTPTYVNATTFTLPGDQTQSFPFGTRVKTVNTGGIVTGTVVRSVYSSSTTVTILPDSGVLDAGLSLVSVGLITATNPSLPGTLTTPPYRNRIVNGAMRIDQVNAGAAQTIVAAAAIAYTMDQFYASCTGANVTVQRVAGTGYNYAEQITGAASNTATLFGQQIGSDGAYDWAGKQVNVQIPISAVGITTVTWNAYVADVADNFSAKTLLSTGTLALSGTVETKYFSFNAGVNAARGIAIEFVTGALVAGQTITYQGAFQAEAGQLSPFERIDIGDDERRCFRYFYTSYDGVVPGTAAAATNRRLSLGLAASTPGVQFQERFPVRMRITPTVTLYNPSTGATASIRDESAGANFVAGSIVTGRDFFFAQNSAAAVAVANLYSMHFTASARFPA